MEDDPLVSQLHNITAGMRKASFDGSNQLTLGELILKLQAIPDAKNDKTVYFDFANAVPTTLDSWRGSYDELALGFGLVGYTPGDYKGFDDAPKLSAVLKELKDALGKTYTGWKGGDFTMTKNTPVWVDTPGNSNNTAIVEVVDQDWRVMLMTQYCEY